MYHKVGIKTEKPCDNNSIKQIFQKGKFDYKQANFL